MISGNTSLFNFTLSNNTNKLLKRTRGSYNKVKATQEIRFLPRIKTIKPRQRTIAKLSSLSLIVSRVQLASALPQTYASKFKMVTDVKQLMASFAKYSD